MGLGRLAFRYRRTVPGRRSDRTTPLHTHIDVGHVRRPPAADRGRPRLAAAVLLWAATLWLWPVPGVVAANDSEKMRVGAWYGEPSFTHAGQFRHCSMIARYANGVSLYFALTADETLTLGLLEAGLGIAPGERAPVLLEIDGRWRHMATAEGSGRLDRIVLTGAPEVVEQLRHGRALRVVATGGAVDLGLTDTARAFERLRDCVEKNSAS